jgi:hypothetical protein
VGGIDRRRADGSRSRGRRKKLIEALRWQHQWGAHVKIWKRLLDNGGEPPRQFFEQPEIDPSLSLHWEAFWDLATERPIGMGVGPIPRSKMRDHVQNEIGLAGDARDRFCAVLIALDDEYLTLANETKKPKPGMRDEVPPDDAQGVKTILQRVVASKKIPDRKRRKS